MPGIPAAAPTLLSVTAECTSVTNPQLSMPPPNAGANGHWPFGKCKRTGQVNPAGIVPLGSAWLPVITLSEIVTLAPGPRCAPGGISIPPPAAQTPAFPVNGIDSGLDRATPPVIVIPLIDTVGSLDAPNMPIVSTCLPPRMRVA